MAGFSRKINPHCLNLMNGIRIEKAGTIKKNYKQKNTNLEDKL